MVTITPSARSFAAGSYGCGKPAAGRGKWNAGRD
jgi:hypothetical protein